MVSPACRLGKILPGSFLIRCDRKEFKLLAKILVKIFMSTLSEMGLKLAQEEWFQNHHYVGG